MGKSDAEDLNVLTLLVADSLMRKDDDPSQQDFVNRFICFIAGEKSGTGNIPLLNES